MENQEENLSICLFVPGSFTTKINSNIPTMSIPATLMSTDLGPKIDESVAEAIIISKTKGAKIVSISAIYVFVSRFPAKSYTKFMDAGMKEPIPIPKKKNVP